MHAQDIRKGDQLHGQKTGQLVWTAIAAAEAVPGGRVRVRVEFAGDVVVRKTYIGFTRYQNVKVVRPC